MVFRWQGIIPASPAIAQHCEMLTNAPECRSQPKPVVTTACCRVRVLGPALAGPRSLPSPWRGVSGAPTFLRPSPWLGLVNRAKHSCGKERGRAQKRSRSPGCSPGGARACLGSFNSAPTCPGVPASAGRSAPCQPGELAQGYLLNGPSHARLWGCPYCCFSVCFIQTWCWLWGFPVSLQFSYVGTTVKLHAGYLVWQC